MRTYTLKSIARRGTLLGAAFAIAASTFTPFAPAVFADALNPLTDRSLTLSSSAPGWDYLDGSGNATYAPPNSGANGQKVGNTFDFKVSTNTASGTDKVQAITFQYCTTPAGNCVAPGNNEYTEDEDEEGEFTRNPNGPAEFAEERSDLEVVIDAPTEATLATRVSDTSSTTNADGVVTSVPVPATAGGNFMVYYLDETDNTWKQSTGWAMDVANNETGNVIDGPAGVPTATGKNNEIQLTHAAGTQGFLSGQRVKVVFFATNSNYITNPGEGAFFVRMNTYKDDEALTSENVIDGGVTVANVMNLGIQITTKVLETMDFSVGTVDPYTLEATGSAGSQLHTANNHTVHNPCEAIVTRMDGTPSSTEPRNRIQLGDSDSEFSLATDKTYSGHSYWRLSSNSSAGATVYYSGNTLTNTVEDEIKPIGATAEAPQVGSEQFGLALANGTLTANDPLWDPVANTNPTHVFPVNYNIERSTGKVYENGADNAAAGLANPLAAGVHSSVTAAGISNLGANASWHSPRLWPLQPHAQYDRGAGIVNSDYIVAGGDPADDMINTAFAFDPTSMLVPVPLASQDNQVVNCVTGKMRYIANIEATTPAGIYTTKINYIAAPQY